MTELLWFVGGLLFGGFVSTMFLCCLQLHRINKYEALIRECVETAMEYFNIAES